MTTIKCKILYVNRYMCHYSDTRVFEYEVRVSRSTLRKTNEKSKTKKIKDLWQLMNATK